MGNQCSKGLYTVSLPSKPTLATDFSEFASGKAAKKSFAFDGVYDEKAHILQSSLYSVSYSPSSLYTTKRRRKRTCTTAST
jgi:hypothetical protein